MTSRQIQVVNDTPGLYASKDMNSFYDMPSGDTTGENSHWVPGAYDVYRDNINIDLQPISRDGEVLRTSSITSGFSEFVNADKLFSSYIPNTSNDERFSFVAKFNQSSKGEKWMYLGSPYKSHFLGKKARWTTSLGLQFSMRTFSDNKSVHWDKTHLVYHKPGDKNLYYSSVIPSHIEVVNDNYRRGYGYVSQRDANVILRDRLITVGALFDFHTRGTGFINLYDFKLLRSRKFRTKRSVLIVPSPHHIHVRQNLKSIPIV